MSQFDQIHPLIGVLEAAKTSDELERIWNEQVVAQGLSEEELKFLNRIRMAKRNILILQPNPWLNEPHPDQRIN